MSRLRLKFSKTGYGKYISHLDLLRTFIRSQTRANLPVKYSQGFNPHQIISFSLPLSVGITSETEFVDIEFNEGTDENEIKEKLNAALPQDLRILNVSLPIKHAKYIVAAEYYITLTTKEAIDTRKFQEFFALKELLIEKKSKRKVSIINLFDFVMESNILSASENKIIISATVSAGSEKNLKPELYVLALKNFINIYTFKTAEIHRVNIFCRNPENFDKFELFY